MNLLPKRNLWVIKSVQAMRMFRITGANWASEAGETVSCRPPVDSRKKPVDAKEDGIENMACAEPHILPQEPTRLPVSEGNPGMPSDSKIQDPGKDVGEFLTRYYGDQEKYFKKIARVNKGAMKRIKKLRKDWLKFVENHF